MTWGISKKSADFKGVFGSNHVPSPEELRIRNDGVACSSHASGTNKIKGLASKPRKAKSKK